MIAAAGCSNNARTTGPVDNSMPTLQLNGDNSNSVRFDNGVKAPDIPANIEGFYLIGFYNYDRRNHCMSLLVGNDNYIELTSLSGNPVNIRSGSLVKVVGMYHAVPGSRCQLPTSFEFRTIIVIATNAIELPDEIHNN